jgi:hypothetical protein
MNSNAVIAVLLCLALCSSELEPVLLTSRLSGATSCMSYLAACLLVLACHELAGMIISAAQLSACLGSKAQTTSLKAAAQLPSCLASPPHVPSALLNDIPCFYCLQAHLPLLLTTSPCWMRSQASCAGCKVC